MSCRPPRTGTVLAIADKLDTLAGIFAIGEKPSGTKDPFGLRRAAIGVARIAVEQRLDLDLVRLLGLAVSLAREDIARAAAAAGKPAPTVAAESVASEVFDYVLERLRAYYLEPGTGTKGAGDSQAAAASITTEMFDAVLATHPVSPLDFDARIRALSTFLTLPEAASLTAANKRVANILRKAGAPPGGERPAGPGATSPGTTSGAPLVVDEALLHAAAERELFEAMGQRREAVAAAQARRDYAGALALLAQLRPAVDAFFDQVMVMAEEPKLRANRLALLTRMRELFAGIADLSRLPG